MRRVLFTLAAFCFVGFASAQYRNSSGSDKWYFGGGFGLSIGTDVTAISASPMVGYKVTDRLSVGTALTYQYVNNKLYDITYSNYGGGPFTRFQVTDKYFTHAEYEYLSFEYADGSLTPDGDFATFRDGYSSLWLGAGYRENIGRSAGFFLLALYNVLYDETEISPYASPLSIRAGVAVGF
mgnify:CR=1 FL=1